MPPRDLHRLLDDLLAGIATAADGAASGRLSADQFQAEMARRLFEGHVAAALIGGNVRTLAPGAEAMVVKAVQDQLPYLDRFADVITADGWQPRDAARAALYAGSVKPTFWRARTFGLDMPYYPGDGSTPCLGNCRCHLETTWRDEENLDADIYWRLGAEKHCGVCPQRAARSPYRFREGVLQ